jgi:hypothetical protein
VTYEWTDDRNTEWVSEDDGETIDVRATATNGTVFHAVAPRSARNTRRPMPSGPWAWSVEWTDGRSRSGEVAAETNLAMLFDLYREPLTPEVLS